MSQHHSRVEKTEAHPRKPGKQGNRSVKKSDNGQGGCSRGSTVSSNSEAAHRIGHDGTYSTVRSNGNTSGAFLQFGTINPGIVNGIQIPARTTSAPPNLDEQNRDQACHDSLRAMPTLPIPSVPKPQKQQQKQENQQPRKDFEGVSKPNSGETHSPMLANRDVPMTVPFQQSQIHFQFYGPNPPMPSQNVVASSLQMTMALPVGNVTRVPHQMFASNIQSHPLQPPAIMHQGQGLGFTPQFGHQVSPQLGSMEVGIAPIFPQQQPGHFSTQKRAVKITHPHTHEVLKLDKMTGSSGQRQLQNASSQSQPLSAFYSDHQINYYNAPYNPSLIFFPPPSLHLTNTQMLTGAQSARYGCPVNQNGQPISFMNPSSLNQAISTSSLAPVQMTIKPTNAPTPEKTVKSSVRVSLPATRSEQPKLSTLPGDVSSVPHQKSSKSDLENSLAFQKPNSELSGIIPPFAIVEASSTVSSTASTQMNETEASPSLHSATVGDSLSDIVENDCGKNEAKQIVESMVDHQKMSNKREPRLPQQQQVIIGSNNDNGTAKSVSNDCASILSVPIECRNSESVSKTDVMRTSSPFVVSLENVNQGYDHAEIELHKLSLEEARNPQISISSNLNATGIVSETPSSVLDGRMVVEFGQIQGGEVSDDVLVGSNSARESAFSATGSLQEMPEVVSHGGKGQAPEKIISAELGASKGVNSEAERTRVLSKPSTSSYDNKDSDKEIDVNEFAAPPPDMSSMPLVLSEIEQNVKVEAVDQSHGVPRMISESKGKPEPTKAKPNRKKKIREILSKADAAGTSDLYNAYKTPDEKHDATISISEPDSRCSTAELKNDASQDCSKVSFAIDEDVHDKVEVCDWEETADASIPRLRTPNNDAEKLNQIDKGNRSAGKKTYSRDFLLTFSNQCNDLPEGFEIGPDIADVVMCTSVGIYHEPHFSPGRLGDRSPRASRADKRISSISDDDKWARGSNAFHMDLNHGTGVLRNTRVQPPTHFTYGIYPSGPMQSLFSQGGMGRSILDIDRWKNANGTQRGMFPSPQRPMEVMHKSSSRYEVGKSSDEEEQKQRRVKAILNKLTPQNFEKLFSQVKDVRIDNTLTLSGVISQIFDKALIEPTFCEMYADFCLHLASELPNFLENNEKITFIRLLLNKCQEEFERGEREQAEVEGEICQTEEEREEKRIRARRRMLGNIRLIGELFKKKMLTERIMHECIQKLFGCYQNPDEEDIESLCKLMSTIGAMIDHSKAKAFMDTYFDRMAMLSTNEKLSSRVRFMLKDTIDLRKNKWQQRRKVEGPKKIEDVHKDAAQERQAQTSRLARGPVVSSRWGQPVNFGHRGTTMLSSASSRGPPTQARGFISREVRHEDRHLYESPAMPVPLPQRSTDDGSITLGPQGGLAKGMSKRGLGLRLNVPSVEKSSRAGDPHRLVSGSNVFSPASDRMASTSRESLSGTSNDQISFQVRNSHLGVRDSHAAGGKPVSSGRDASVAKSFSEDTLREKSISALREFYSAKDEEEVVSCIKELNAPYFYPSMVSLWITDSFERKDFERNLLADLLVNLSRAQNILITRSQLIAGFESVLSSLEDAVNDAPKAAEFLGHIFGKVVVENVLLLKEIGRMILEGGEEPGSLTESGLASEVLFGILEYIKTEKGDSFLNEFRRESNLRLEDFRPRKPTPKSKRLDAFL